MITLTHANINVGAAGEENSLFDSQKSTASITTALYAGLTLPDRSVAGHTAWLIIYSPLIDARRSSGMLNCTNFRASLVARSAVQSTGTALTIRAFAAQSGKSRSNICLPVVKITKCCDENQRVDDDNGGLRRTSAIFLPKYRPS